MTILTEAEVEAAALYWLEGLGWRVPYGPDIEEGRSAIRAGLGKVRLAIA